MSEDVGSRVVRVGLASREQLAEALSLSQRAGMALVEALVCTGVDEESLAQLFVAEGLAAPLSAGALEEGPIPALAGFDGAMALAFLALPSRFESGRLSVAMADPTDTHAVAELRRRAGTDVVPFVARVSVVRDAILARFPEARSSLPSDSVPPEPRSLLESQKSAVPPARAVSESNWPERPSTKAAPSAPKQPSAPPAHSVHARDLSVDRWGDLATGNGASAEKPPSRTRFGAAPDRATRLPEVASVLAGIRAATTRDGAIGLACEGAVAIARSAAFFAVRRDSLRGQVARGPLLDDTKAKLVEVPSGAVSVLGRVVEEQRPYFGPFGTSAVDQMLRVSLGSRGGPLSVHPVEIDARVVGVLVVDEVGHGERGDERIAMLAHALGAALRRLLSEARKP